MTGNTLGPGIWFRSSYKLIALSYTMMMEDPQSETEDFTVCGQQRTMGLLLEVPRGSYALEQMTAVHATSLDDSPHTVCVQL